MVKENFTEIAKAHVYKSLWQWIRKRSTYIYTQKYTSNSPTKIVHSLTPENKGKTKN